jgi:hypothetical protein
VAIKWKKNTQGKAVYVTATLYHMQQVTFIYHHLYIVHYVQGRDITNMNNLFKSMEKGGDNKKGW